MKSRIGKRGTALAVVALAATAIAGGALAAVAAHSTAATTTTLINAKETDYHIALSRVTAPPGVIKFTVHNASKTAHKFGVKGPGSTTKVAKAIVGTIAPGATKTLTVTITTKGKYTVYCALHASLGMKTLLTIGSGTGTTTTHTTTTSTTTHWS
jgi:plastocyanin